METPTINEVYDEGVSERFSSFVIELRHILLQAVKHEDRRIASKLVDLLANSFFNFNIVRLYIKKIADYKHVNNRNTTEFMKCDRFCRVLVSVRNGKKNACGTIREEYAWCVSKIR